MGEGKLRERGEDTRGGEGREEEDRHGQRWEMKLLALWDARLSSLPHSVNGIPSFHFGQLLVPHYVADAIHFLGLSLSLLCTWELERKELGSLHSPSAEDMLARPRIRDCHLQFGNFALSANSSTTPPLPKLERAKKL